MNRSALTTSARVLWANDVLFSLNIAWLAIWYARSHPRWTWLYQSALVEYPYSHIRHVEPPTVIVQTVWAIVFAAAILLVLRFLVRGRRLRSYVRNFAGLFAITSFPIFALCFPLFFFDPWRIEAHVRLLTLETIAAAACWTLFCLRIWPRRSLLGLVLLLIHFISWAWVTGTYINPLAESRDYGLWSFGLWTSLPFWLGFPVIGFLSSLMSSMYVSLREKIPETERA